MKINPVALQSYQQIVRKDTQPQETVDTQLKKRGDMATITGDKVTIKPSTPEKSSELAVKSASGNYADLLSPQEKQALDLLFSKFRDSERFGKSYKVESDSPAEINKNLGRLIDVKV